MIARAAVFALAKALEGIPVLGALADSPAARAGIRYGDVLLSVNGRRTRTVLDYIEAKSLRTDGMDIVVFRSGAEKIEQLAYDATAPAIDPSAILEELITLRIGGVHEDEGGSNGPPQGTS
jgi:S1-C subfamily serine protease